MPRARNKRRRMSMTPLIDIIFLLLLFFMLSSTFTKFAEVELTVAGSGSAPSDTPPLFLQLGPDSLALNGQSLSLETLGTSPLAEAQDGTTLLVSLRGEVTAQRLTDLLVALRPWPSVTVTVLGSKQMIRRRPSNRQNREPTIALINIVFLMLVFFMVAGALTRPLDKDLSLVQTRDLDGRAPPDALVIHADGRLDYRGETQSDAAGWLAAQDDTARAEVRLVPDRDLPAADLVRLTRDLRDAGAERIVLVTERALP